jgi:ribosomal protein S18 acetylase RimI-like enzyme
MIRKARIEDLQVLVEGNRAMAHETEGVRLDPDVLRDGVRAVLEDSRLGTYWVYEETRPIVAQLLITTEWSDWRNRFVWWVQSVYVHPDHRRRGLYRKLYAAVRDAAREAGAGGLRLYVDTSNTRAQATYAALGMNGDHYRVFEEMFAEPPRESRAS